ncbi:MAG: AAA family ATPase, partial [Thermomicrobiales bacterium]
MLAPFESSRAVSLLAYLLLNRDGPQQRQTTAFRLWPDSSEAQARTNLRHLLHTLRGLIPDSERFIDVTPRTLQWRADAPFWLDVAEFERAVNTSDGQAAIELYRGDLLAGHYDEWLVDERDRLRQHYLLTLERLTRALESTGAYARAIAYAGQIQRYDPLYEESYRLLMRLHNANGDRARAVRVYHECATTLERELGVEPSRATREAYEALLASEPEHPPQQAPRAQVRSPLVGRASEWEQLTTCWHAAEHGSPRFVLISGEAGIGKTRLVEDFRAWCEQRGALVAEARSYAAEGALSYGPIVDWLRSDGVRMRRGRLDQTTLSILTRLLPEIYDEHPDLPSPLLFSESDQRQRQFTALAGALSAPSMPLLLIIDDIHWSDRETLQFLHFLLRSGPQARLLVAATARREEVDARHPLNDLLTGLRTIDRLAEIELERLTREETIALAERLSGRSSGEFAADRLFRETEGNPLFIVEALRAGWIESFEPGGWMSPRVQAVIESRLAQLSEFAGELIGIAAAIGRAFSTDVLGGASDLDDETLIRGLDELWRRRIIREHGADGYDFTHDKIREVAYLNLSPVQRRHIHIQIAQVLEQLNAGHLEAVSGLLAAHYEHAGRTEQAVAWLILAAETARHRHASADAALLLERALKLLNTLNATPERQKRELEILTALPAALVATEGYRSRRVVEIHERALSITQQLGIEPEPPLLRSLAVSALARNDFQTAQEFGAQLLRYGQGDEDSVL